MMKSVIFLSFVSSLAFAGLPPTTSKVTGDTGNVTTFNYQFPNFTGTHTGTTLSLGVNSILGGGTGATTKSGAFDALSPMTTGGDLIYGGASGTGTRLANGSLNQILTSNGGTNAPSWKSLSTLLDGTYFKFGGNSFGANTSIGTTDNNDLQIIRNGATKIYVGSAGVAVGGSTPTTSAALDIQGTSGALLVPRLTTTQKNALTATAGMVVYDTTLARFECYDGAWGSCSKPSLSVQTPTAGSSLTLDLGAAVQRIRLTPASAISLSTTVPLGSSAPVDGAQIILVGTSDTNTVTITASDTAKGVYDYDFVLGRGDVVTLIYSATDDRFYIKSTGH